MLVLVSEKQGTNKSTALKVLAVQDEWFCDTLPLSADDKKVIEQLQGKWIIECSELAGMKKAQIEEVKALLSRQVDRARPAYGRLPIEAPRQCVFFGTTNKVQFLRDFENRRYWPVMITEFDVDALLSDREMLWGEAAAMEAEYPPDKHIELDRELWPVAAEVQAAHKISDGWVELLDEHLGHLTGRILPIDVWKILEVREGQRSDQRLVEARGNAMRDLGWQYRNLRFERQKKWCYVKGEGADAKQVLYVSCDENGKAVCVSPAPDPSMFEPRAEATNACPPFRPDLTECPF